MDGFRKLGEMKSGDYSPDVKEPKAAAIGVMNALGSYGRERTFDNLPLHIQEWSRRCRGLSHA